MKHSTLTKAIVGVVAATALLAMTPQSAEAGGRCRSGGYYSRSYYSPRYYAPRSYYSDCAPAYYAPRPYYRSYYPAYYPARSYYYSDSYRPRGFSFGFDYYR